MSKYQKIGKNDGRFKCEYKKDKPQKRVKVKVKMKLKI